MIREKKRTWNIHCNVSNDDDDDDGQSKMEIYCYLFISRMNIYSWVIHIFFLSISIQYEKSVFYLVFK